MRTIIAILSLLQIVLIASYSFLICRESTRTFIIYYGGGKHIDEKNIVWILMILQLSVLLLTIMFFLFRQYFPSIAWNEGAK